jgi:C1A family cysteine protease
MEEIMSFNIRKSNLKIIMFFLTILFFFTNSYLILPVFGYNNDLKSDFNIYLPSSFDLRDVDGNNYISSVKTQEGGTCWAYSSFASIESNLLINDNWIKNIGFIEPNLAEYHMDWWNGFNRFNNDDDQDSDGIFAHAGGNYLIASAYLSRGDGAIMSDEAQSYYFPPEKISYNYTYYYVGDIEWYKAERDLSRINEIKYKIMTEGAIATCVGWDQNYLDNNFTFYQPFTSILESNHAVTIIGWDDEKITQASNCGAWLCKNSWGIDWGIDGYFWISYYDKHCCQHPELGAVSFNNVKPMIYDNIYYHDYHGWRDTFNICNSVMNCFIADDDELLQAVSFFTAAENVEYIIKIYDRFEDGKLKDELSYKSGKIDYKGFHTIDLDNSVEILKDDDFYIYLKLTKGGYPYDRTCVIWKFLAGKPFLFPGYIIKSKASRGESFFQIGSYWVDLNFINPSANFCIKGLSSKIN